MDDWIDVLSPGQRVLDVGSGPGSFTQLRPEYLVVSLDEDLDAFVTAASPRPGQARVFARSNRMPFAAESFDLVVCHHSLEHIAELDETLDEIARVLAPAGRFYVAVPNGYGLCDGIYRWVFEGGGHVNRFRRADLVARVERRVGVRLSHWQKLYSSFAYLWRLAKMLEAPPRGLAKRLIAIGRLPRRAITVTQRALYSGSRISDRAFGTNFAVYGWALFFDRKGGDGHEDPAYLNVCRYCGLGHPADGLSRPLPGKFACSSCGGVTPYFRPFRNTK